ncbi:hypothetical protein ABPG72_019077 [Tetrahymena utriculariae]
MSQQQIEFGSFDYQEGSFDYQEGFYDSDFNSELNELIQYNKTINNNEEIMHNQYQNCQIFDQTQQFQYQSQQSQNKKQMTYNQEIPQKNICEPSNQQYIKIKKHNSFQEICSNEINNFEKKEIVDLINNSYLQDIRIQNSDKRIFIEQEDNIQQASLSLNLNNQQTQYQYNFEQKQNLELINNSQQQDIRVQHSDKTNSIEQDDNILQDSLLFNLSNQQSQYQYQEQQENQSNNFNDFDAMHDLSQNQYSKLKFLESKNHDDQNNNHKSLFEQPYEENFQFQRSQEQQQQPENQESQQQRDGQFQFKELEIISIKNDQPQWQDQEYQHISQQSCKPIQLQETDDNYQLQNTMPKFVNNICYTQMNAENQYYNNQSQLFQSASKQYIENQLLYTLTNENMDYADRLQESNLWEKTILQKNIIPYSNIQQLNVNQLEYQYLQIADAYQNINNSNQILQQNKEEPYDIEKNHQEIHLEKQCYQNGLKITEPQLINTSYKIEIEQDTQQQIQDPDDFLYFRYKNQDTKNLQEQQKKYYNFNEQEGQVIPSKVFQDRKQNEFQQEQTQNQLYYQQDKACHFENQNYQNDDFSPFLNQSTFFNETENNVGFQKQFAINNQSQHSPQNQNQKIINETQANNHQEIKYISKSQTHIPNSVSFTSINYQTLETCEDLQRDYPISRYNEQSDNLKKNRYQNPIYFDQQNTILQQSQTNPLNQNQNNFYDQLEKTNSEYHSKPQDCSSFYLPADNLENLKKQQPQFLFNQRLKSNDFFNKNQFNHNECFQQQKPSFKTNQFECLNQTSQKLQKIPQTNQNFLNTHHKQIEFENNHNNNLQSQTNYQIKEADNFLNKKMVQNTNQSSTQKIKLSQKEQNCIAKNTKKNKYELKNSIKTFLKWYNNNHRIKEIIQYLKLNEEDKQDFMKIISYFYSLINKGDLVFFIKDFPYVTETQYLSYYVSMTTGIFQNPQEKVEFLQMKDFEFIINIQQIKFQFETNYENFDIIRKKINKATKYNRIYINYAFQPMGEFDKSLLFEKKWNKYKYLFFKNYLLRILLDPTKMDSQDRNKK